ncbi:MAG: hypothetical protein Q8P07_02810 [bacterium]|nr:hypothetical protein [bacterium]
MKIEETLYIKILIWAYKRQEAGFAWEELTKEFQLSFAQEQWVIKIFRSNVQASDNLIDHLSYNENNNEHRYVITSKGTSAAIGYLNLKEAERSGKRAERVAWVAICTGIVVGAFQIIGGLLQVNCR